MKTAKLLIPLLLLAACATAQTKPKIADKAPAAAVTPAITYTPNDELYEHFVLKHTEDAAPAGYGTSTEHPILVGAYEADLSDQKKIGAMMNRFIRTYLWADGTPIVYVSRTSQMISGVNYDIFKVTKVGSKDTISLYTDMYKTGLVLLPKGFSFYTKQMLGADLAPTLDLIKQYDAFADKYGDAAAKALSFKILGILQNNIGLEYLMDQDYIGVVINDSGVNLDLKAFLVRSYIFHKFVYELNGQADAKVKAYNFMLDDYQAVIKTNDIFAKGSLPGLVKK